ncbi:hypothetical protein E2C01_018688 [Portunus trituberculatus]|uniref:Uncharacterized protein n=1 Tax=Portunus trituberculatus TaxID=210409 RepID=A0A5B7DVP7_PORTR|nr:hypothetical protein [Portunus trituberculatus]
MIDSNQSDLSLGPILVRESPDETSFLGEPLLASCFDSTKGIDSLFINSTVFFGDLYVVGHFLSHCDNTVETKII